MSILFWTAFSDDWEQNHKVVFDGVNKYIIVYPYVTTLDIKSDVYSAWKEWMLIRDNGKYAQAIRSIGGDPTTGSQRAGDIYFLINGWKLIIDFSKTNVSGILFSDDFDTAYYDEYLNPIYPAQISSTVNAIETKQTILDSAAVDLQYQAMLTAIAKSLTLEEFLALK